MKTLNGTQSFLSNPDFRLWVELAKDFKPKDCFYGNQKHFLATQISVNYHILCLNLAGILFQKYPHFTIMPNDAICFF